MASNDAWWSVQGLSSSGAAQAAGMDTQHHSCRAVASTHRLGGRGTGISMMDISRMMLLWGWDPYGRA